MHPGISHSEPTNDYELLQRVGVGSFGEVYKAKHIRNNSLAAIKIVKLEAGENFAVIQQEILMLRECVHANIISYYSSYIKRDKLWIVMEYCAGGSLQDIYQLSGPLLELQIAFVCRETLKGLQYLHRRGKIHRDIKGANILLTHSGDIKLADFGVAAQITATLGKRKSFIGTPYWMAPEVASVERRGGYGVECDVWAVGITAIELAELQPPLFELHPMQVLYLMTKSSYKSPRLKDKARWSSTMQDFIKCCLTKNPRKRPSPDRLLSSHAFVKGALSSRLTRDLLDKLNNLGRPTPREGSSTPTPEDDLSSFVTDSSSPETGLEDGDYFRKVSIASTSSSKSNQEVPIIKTHLPTSQSNPNDLSLSGTHMSDTQSVASAATVTCVGTIRSSASDNAFYSEASAVSAPPIVTPTSKTRMLIEKAFRFPTNSIKAKHARSTSVSSVKSEGESVRRRESSSDELPKRPVTCLGLPPTPKVSMGACFFTVFHNTELSINWSANWVNPINKHQYVVFGAEEGIFMLDLYELHEAQLIQIYQTRCSWIYIIDNIMMSLQGKTPYLYRHDMLQLVQQEAVMQKLSKKMNKVPEKFKPKALMATMRLPETKDCVQCVVRNSLFNDNLYLACAVPGAMLLYQWYEPQQKFVLLKRHELDRFMKPQPMKPFDLVFGDAQTNSDYPLLCYGVYRKIGDEEAFDFQMVNFNDHGRLEDFLANSQNLDLVDTDTLKPFTSRKFKFDTTMKVEPAALRQLEKDTLMLAYRNQVLLVSLDGQVKQSILMKTAFSFDFHVEYAVALPDSVLAFHRCGVEGRSFDTGAVTQDLDDRTTVYEVIGDEPIIILKSHKGMVSSNESSKESSPDYSRAATLAASDTLKSPTAEDLDNTLTPTTAQQVHTKKSSLPPMKTGYNLCILTGHVSTLEEDQEVS